MALCAERRASGTERQMSLTDDATSLLLLLARRLRVSLGLKPLKLEAEAPKGPSAEAVAAKEADDAAAKAEALAERIKL